MTEPLHDAQLTELIADLEALGPALVVELQAAKNSAAPVDLETPIGRLSRMDAMQAQNMASANQRNIEMRMRLVRQALSAVEDGTYGECRSCEEPIPFKRLKARPEAPFCVRCAR